MPKMIQGDLSAKGLKFGIVAARFNDFITSRLLDGALDALQRHGAADGDIEIVKVPGAYEIPLAAKMLARSKKYNAVICLGAVIRGATPHFEYVSAEVSKGVAAVSLETGLPVIFGVLTTDTIEQAIERAGTKSGNKGWDAALSAIEMANVMKQLRIMGQDIQGAAAPTSMKRRKAREYALQILFQLDIRKEKPSATVLKHFWAEYDPDEEVKAFAEEIVKGTFKHFTKINELIHECAKNWSLDRMAVVDRNVLRMAVYEILYRMDIPTSVTINEAIEIAKKFGTDDSGSFVNGILDSVARVTGKLDEGKIEE